MTGPGRLDRSLGLERVARNALIIIMRDLNDEIQVQENLWTEDDEQMADLRGQPYVPVELELVPAHAFHLGNKPSLLDDSTPLQDYPAVSVMAYRVGEAGEGDDDHAERFTDQMYVELFVKSSPEEGEEVCNLRSWRTADAVHNVISRDTTLEGACDPLADPNCVVSEVFLRSENPSEATGSDWFWQAARIEYGAEKVSPLFQEVS